jgi:hypothetical protein
MDTTQPTGNVATAHSSAGKPYTEEAERALLTLASAGDRNGRRRRLRRRSREVSQIRASDSSWAGEGEGGHLFDEISNLVEPTERSAMDG